MCVYGGVSASNWNWTTRHGAHESRLAGMQDQLLDRCECLRPLRTFILISQRGDENVGAVCVCQSTLFLCVYVKNVYVHVVYMCS